MKCKLSTRRRADQAARLTSLHDHHLHEEKNRRLQREVEEESALALALSLSEQMAREEAVHTSLQRLWTSGQEEEACGGMRGTAPVAEATKDPQAHAGRRLRAHNVTMMEEEVVAAAAAASEAVAAAELAALAAEVAAEEVYAAEQAAQEAAARWADIGQTRCEGAESLSSEMVVMAGSDAAAAAKIAHEEAERAGRAAAAVSAGIGGTGARAAAEAAAAAALAAAEMAEEAARTAGEARLDAEEQLGDAVVACASHAKVSAAAREAAAKRVAAARDLAVRQAAEMEVAARQAEGREMEGREVEAREVVALEAATREAEARDAAARDTLAKEAAHSADDKATWEAASVAGTPVEVGTGTDEEWQGGAVGVEESMQTEVTGEAGVPQSGDSDWPLQYPGGGGSGSGGHRWHETGNVAPSHADPGLIRDVVDAELAAGANVAEEARANAHRRWLPDRTQGQAAVEEDPTTAPETDSGLEPDDFYSTFDPHEGAKRRLLLRLKAERLEAERLAQERAELAAEAARTRGEAAETASSEEAEQLQKGPTPASTATALPAEEDELDVSLDTLLNDIRQAGVY